VDVRLGGVVVVDLCDLAFRVVGHGDAALVESAVVGDLGSWGWNELVEERCELAVVDLPLEHLLGGGAELACVVVGSV